TLRLERKVQVLERLLGLGCEDGRLQRVVELALLLDALQDRRAAVLEFRDILRALAYLAKLDFVQPARDFLAVASDEGQGRTLAEEREGTLDVGRRQRKFVRDPRDEGGRKRLGHRVRNLEGPSRIFHALRQRSAAPSSASILR